MKDSTKSEQVRKIKEYFNESLSFKISERETNDENDINEWIENLLSYSDTFVTYEDLLIFLPTTAGGTSGDLTPRYPKKLLKLISS